MHLTNIETSIETHREKRNICWNQYQLILCMTSHQTNDDEEPNHMAWRWHRQIYVICIWYLFAFGEEKHAKHREVYTILFGVNVKHGQADQADQTADEKTQLYIYEYVLRLRVYELQGNYTMWNRIVHLEAAFKSCIHSRTPPQISRYNKRIHSQHGVWCNCWSTQRLQFNRPRFLQVFLIEWYVMSFSHRILSTSLHRDSSCRNTCTYKMDNQSCTDDENRIYIYVLCG